MLIKSPKLIISCFLVLTIIALTLAFWPRGGDEIVNSNDTVNKVSTEQQSKQFSEQLYQQVLALKERGEDLSFEEQREMLDYCRQIIDDYPDSPEASKAKALMEELVASQQELFARQPRLTRQTEPKVQKSRPLRQRTFR